MFDWLGTFNKSQFEAFLGFARAQIPIADLRIRHLLYEQTRVGSLVFRFDGGTPVVFGADPRESLLGRLLVAYEVQGGNPFRELRVRAMTQPLFLRRGSESLPATTMSNDEVVGAKGLADASSAVLLQRMKEPFLDVLQNRFGRLERKIKRAIDYSDQLGAEAKILTRMKQTIEVEGSLEELAERVYELISSPEYRAVYDDQGSDPFGFNTHAPFSSYDAAVGKTAETPQRQGSGFVGPGQTG